MNKEREIQKLYKAQKLALYWLLGLIYSGFIGLQLGRIQAIADYNYTLHEIMYVPFTVAGFVGPVVFLIYMYLLFKYLLVRGNQKTTVKTITKALLVVASIFVVVSITTHQFRELSTTGIYKVEVKLHEDRKYFLVVDDKKVRVSYNEFQLVEENKQYLIHFIWNKRTPNKGQLKTIEPLKIK